MSTWPLTAAQREDTVQRTANSIAALAFAKHVEISGEQALSVASAIEKRAYTAAEVAAKTTTGDRPAIESVKAYARKLGELALEVVAAGGKLEQGGAVAAGASTDAIDLTGGRDFLTSETTEQVLAAVLAPGSQVSKIKFSTKSFGRDAANVAARAIANVASVLKDADISDVIAGRPEAEALDVLRVLSEALAATKLRSLNLSDNALGEKGVRACAAVLSSQAALESLSLQNVGCSIHACRAVLELLQNAQALKQLHLFNNMSGDEGASFIGNLLSRAPCMQDFRMASSRVGPQGGIALAAGLGVGRNLMKLDISDNPMTEEVVPALIACLSQQPQLTALNLNDTSLTNDGAVQLCLALSGPETAPKLKELELALNEINGITGARAVALLAASKPHLTKLNVRENELGERGALVVAKGLERLEHIATVDLCGNQIRRVGALAVAKALVGKASLQLLALDENFISGEGQEQLKEFMEEAGKAHVLGPLDENMSEDEEEEEEEGDEGDDFGLAEKLASAGLN